MEQEGKTRFIGTVEKAGESSRIRVFKKFCEGLHRLDRFSHVIVLYWLHLRDNPEDRKTLKVVPRSHPAELRIYVSL